MQDRPSRILLLTLLFSPDGVSTAHLLGALVRQLHKTGHDLLVVTTTPHYNVDRDARNSQPLARGWLPMFYTSVFDGVPVWHVPIHRKGTRVFRRVFDYLVFHAVSIAIGVCLRNRYDIILAPSPPLTTGVAAVVLARLTGRNLVYNVQELYPDVAIELGVLTNSLVIKASRWLEQFVYRQSTAVVVISEGFRRRLVERGVPVNKLIVIPNFAMDEPAEGRAKLNTFSHSHALDKSFVVLYAGNLGLTQDFETVIRAAQELDDLREVRFLIVGDGARRAWLATRLTELGLGNIQLLPYLPSQSVPEMYDASDVCLVPLKHGTADVTFPSKIYTIMAYGRPAIVLAEANSDVGCLVSDAACGWRIEPGDAHGLALAIRRALADPSAARKMGRAGRDYALRHHTAPAVALRYEHLFRDLARRSQSN